MKDKRILIPVVLFFVIILGTGYALLKHHQLCPTCYSFKIFSPMVIKHFVESFGPWGMGVYIFLYILNTISLFPPIAIMSLSAGFLFGPVKGFVALSAGAFLGTSATFFLARQFGAPIVAKFVKGEKAMKFQENLGKNGFFVILPIRLVGFPPWEVVNYVSGLSKITYRAYISATMIGILPAIVIQVFFSDRLASFDLKDPTLYMAIGAFVLLAVVPAFYLNKIKSKESKNNAKV